MSGKPKANTIIAKLDEALAASLERGEQLPDVLKSLFFGIRLDIESFTRLSIGNASAKGLLSLKEYLKFVKHHCGDVAKHATEDVFEEMLKLNAAIFTYTASDISRRRIKDIFGHIHDGFKDGISDERKARINQFLDDLEELNISRPNPLKRVKEVKGIFEKLTEIQPNNLQR